MISDPDPETTACPATETVVRTTDQTSRGGARGLDWFVVRRASAGNAAKRIKPEPSVKVLKLIELGAGGSPARWVKHAEQCLLESELPEVGPESWTWPVLISSHFKPTVVQTAIMLWLTPVAPRAAWLSVGTSDDSTIAKATIKA